MIRSMTGFGSISRMANGFKLQVDAKSVNHRYSEIAVRMPREWLCYEDGIKKTVQQFVKRGRVDMFVTIEPETSSDQSVYVNWPLVESYRTAAEQLQQALDLPDRLTLHQLLTLPDIVHARQPQPEPAEWLEAELLECARLSLAMMTNMRETEGESLRNDLHSRLRNVESLRAEIRQLAPHSAKEYRDKLQQRMNELLEGRAEPDESRVMAEVALYADRIGIDEELTRLDSHISQCASLLETDEPVGRKLDFIIQEMNREVNTIGSKANHNGIINRVVEMKVELEKIREQVQNIE